MAETMNLKKLTVLFLTAIILMLALCSCKNEETLSLEAEPEEVKDKYEEYVEIVKENYTTEESGMREVPADKIVKMAFTHAPVDMENFSEVYVCSQAEYPNIDMVFIGVAKDEECLKKAEEQLSSYSEKTAKIYADYDAVAADRAKNFEIRKDGLIICFVMGENCDDIIKTIFGK